ncbi:sensor domain-containing diguanylate cyclase [Echinimonas agarilytica]|uniref:diguanylate cyclase n=1 Tax=Echinimonas agarilytica TaxID=1215918 RepID=A0AA41W3U3_9GAMM|nr:diguanylate cyclase [Echinimonas agarilytica]MCM2678138.1 GGDEF domain-containing protein [Echinimonas agarilytica]
MSDLSIQFSIRDKLTAIQSYVLKHGLVQAALFIAAWLIVFGSGALLDVVNYASLWFPAAGLTFAVLVVVGWRSILPLMFCAVVGTFWTDSIYGLNTPPDELFVTGILFGVGHIASYYIGARLLLYISDTSLQNLPRLATCFLILSAVCSFLATISVLTALVWSGAIDDGSHVDTWLPFWIGDLAGMAVTAPIFCFIIAKLYPHPKFWIGEHLNQKSTTSFTEFLYKCSLGLGLLLVVMLLASISEAPEAAYAAFFLILPQMWITYTETPLRTSLSLALLSLAIALLVTPFDVMQFALVYQFVICVVAATTLYGLAVPALIADNRALRGMVLKDSLTQTTSRNELINRVEKELKQAQRQKSELCLIVFDLDKFKHINDKFGHVAGDRALISAADCAKDCLRETDILGRFGGDEFVVVLPFTSADAAVLTAERIRLRLTQVTVDHGVTLSGSFGVSAVTGVDSFNRAFERADKALYRAKDLGRNQVCCM